MAISLLLTALMMSLSGAGHCLGMCGGLATALGLNRQPKLYVLLYSMGRITSYVLAALFFTFLAQQLPSFKLPYLQIVGFILLILLALHLGNWFSGITVLEKAGAGIWKIIQPLAKPLLPINKAHKALFAGMVWGWLPCGLVYSAIAIAATTANFWHSSLFMLVFGLGTLPAMLSIGWFSQHVAKFVNNPLVKRGFALILLIWAIAGLILIFI